MEMVAAARLRRAEQRIAALRPYAEAIRRMTREAAEAAGQVPNMPILNEHESVSNVGLLLIAGDRGPGGRVQLADRPRRCAPPSRELDTGGKKTLFFASGRRPASSLTFRGLEPAGSFTGFSDRPSFADARKIAEALISAYVDGEVDRVEIFYNGYVSAISQVVRRETLLPLQQASILDEGDDDQAATMTRVPMIQPKQRALVEYEPDPDKILGRLVPDYVEISIYRALLESTASEHGAR